MSKTLVNAGTLILSGTNIQAADTNGGFGSATTGRYQVESGATLGGTGRINVALASATSVNNVVLVKSGGTLAAGLASAIGALTIDGAGFVPTNGNDFVLNMASGAKFSFQLGAGKTSDEINFWNYSSGTLSLNSNTISFLNAGVDQTGLYRLFTFYSDSGGAETTSGISTGLVADFGATGISGSLVYNTNSIDLNVLTIPEPGTAVLLAMGLACVAAMRRRLRKEWTGPRRPKVLSPGTQR